MGRKLAIALVTLGSATALAVLAFALVGYGETAASSSAATIVEVPPLAALQPDTSSSNWKPLSDDVGLMIRKDDRLGLRARLFVRVNGTWAPVATDGIADSLGAIPIK